MRVWVEFKERGRRHPHSWLQNSQNPRHDTFAFKVDWGERVSMQAAHYFHPALGGLLWNYDTDMRRLGFQKGKTVGVWIEFKTGVGPHDHSWLRDSPKPRHDAFAFKVNWPGGVSRQHAHYINPKMEGQSSRSTQTPENIEKKEQHLAEKIVQRYDAYLAASSLA